MVSFDKPSSFDSRFEVVGCLLEYGEKILILERQDHKPQGGAWGMPAGKIDAGESSLDAMVRELEEETRFKAKPEDLVFVRRLYVQYPDYDFVYDLYRLPLKASPAISIDHDEHKSFLWITPKEALQINLMADFDACLKIAYGI